MEQGTGRQNRQEAVAELRREVTAQLLAAGRRVGPGGGRRTESGFGSEE